MKITIDTKEDSHSEIRKVISMLQALVGSEEKAYSNRDIFSEPSPEVKPSDSGGVFGNLFGSDKIEEKTDEEKKEEPESDENVEVIPY